MMIILSFAFLKPHESEVKKTGPAELKQLANAQETQ